MSFADPSQNLRRKLRGTHSRIRYLILRSHTEDHQRQVHDPSITTSADLNNDMTREATAGPAPDVTRASGEDHTGGDVVMREDEKSGGHPSSEGSDSRRRITTKREQREVRDEPDVSDRAPPNSTFRGGSWVRRRLANKLWLSPRKRHWTDPARQQ